MKEICNNKKIAEIGKPIPKAIEEETGIPKSTILYRLKNLGEEGIIEDRLFTLNLDKIGLNLTAITEVMAEYSEGYHEEVARTLSDIEGVNQVYFTAGETDFTVMAHFASREMVEDLISSYEKIDGVKRTITNFVITTIKDEQIPIRDFEFDMLKQLVNTS